MTGGGMGVRGAALVVGAVLVLGGCGKSTEGSATGTSSAPATSAAATTTDSDAALWDPCSLPDSALTATALDPATKEKDVGGSAFSGWKVCSWRSTARWYDLTVFSGSPTLQDIRNRPDFQSFTSTTVGSHQAVQFLDVGDDKGLRCTIAVEVPRGSVAFRVLTRYSVGKLGDPCAEARRHADDLTKYLPEN